jgi:hypothetical protein
MCKSGRCTAVDTPVAGALARFVAAPDVPDFEPPVDAFRCRWAGVRILF